MSKSKFVIDKLAKIFEQGLVNYKDLADEILNILKSKRDEIIFRMKITSKEETEILKKRVENLEKKIQSFEKKRKKKLNR
tara:strand:+ start:395 stop:634 length:240 start_codon:yes stop_codon:yes gene_type:complete